MRFSCQACTGASCFSKAMRTLGSEPLNWHGLCSLPHLRGCQCTPQRNANIHASRQASIQARCSGLRICKRVVYDQSRGSFGFGPESSKRMYGGWQRASAAALGTGSPVCRASLLCTGWIPSVIFTGCYYCHQCFLQLLSVTVTMPFYAHWALCAQAARRKLEGLRSA